jgi:prophage regulatory protein
MHYDKHQIRAERVPEVLLRTGLSRSTLYAQIAAGTFPQPIKISARATAFLAHEVTQWLADRSAARSGSAAL